MKDFLSRSHSLKIYLSESSLPDSAFNGLRYVINDVVTDVI